MKKDLFIRGFLITDKKINDVSGFPFYGNWEVKESSGYYFMAHNLTGMHLYVTDEGNKIYNNNLYHNQNTRTHRSTVIR